MGDEPITEQDLYDADLEDFLSCFVDDTAPTSDQRAPPADEPPLAGPSREDPEATPPAPVKHAPTGITSQRVLDLTTQAAAFYAEAYPGSASAAYLTARFGTDLTGTPLVVGHAGSDGTALLRHLYATADASPEELVDATPTCFTWKSSNVPLAGAPTALSTAKKRSPQQPSTGPSKPSVVPPRSAPVKREQKAYAYTSNESKHLRVARPPRHSYNPHADQLTRRTIS